MRKDKRKPSCFNLLANIGLDEVKLVNMGTVEGISIHDDNRTSSGVKLNSSSWRRCRTGGI
jgi:hypothetical protein